MPAGIQFGEPEPLPDTSYWYGPPVTSDDGTTTIVFGSRSGRKVAGIPTSSARALVLSADTATDVAMDDGNQIDAPSGFPSIRGGTTPLAATYGPNGFVAVGQAHFWTSNGFAATLRAAIWHSTDGRQWQRVDPRDIVGAGKQFGLSAVVGTSDGYLAAGVLSNAAEGQSEIAILASANGLDWELRGTIEATYSIEPDRLYLLGDEIVLAGTEYACTDNSTFVHNFGWGSQARLWHSADDGATWQQVDLLATGLVTQAETPPARITDCPAQGPELNDRFGTTGGPLGVANNQVVLTSGLLDRAATSADLASWSAYDLPGAVPADGGSSGASGRLVVADGADIAVLVLEHRRDATDNAQDNGWQVLAWRLVAGTVTGVRLPAARPMILTDTNNRLFAGPMGEVWLQEEQGQSSALLNGAVSIRHSTAGPLDPWGACAAGPGADCRFSSSTLALPGANLAGIDLRGATVSGDLTGANLAGAQFDAALVYADLAGADLTGVSAIDAGFYGSLAGANVSGADLSGARVDATFFGTQRDDATTANGLVVFIEKGQTLEGHDFAGDNLAGYSFFGSDAGTLRDADFTNTDLSSASFSFVDLSGADFSGAKLDGSYFGTGVICPDGDPPTSGEFGAASCRLH